MMGFVVFTKCKATKLILNKDRNMSIIFHKIYIFALHSNLTDKYVVFR
jgi:hypothetical protein